jgi:hypothetical protein
MGHGDRHSASRSPPRSGGTGAQSSTGSVASSVKIPEPPLKMPRRDGSSIPVPGDFESSLDAIWNKKLEESKGQLFDSIKTPLEGLVKAVIVETSKALSDRVDVTEQGQVSLAQAQSVTEQALGALSEEFKAFKLEAVKEFQRTQKAVADAQAKMSSDAFRPNSNSSEQAPDVTNMGGFFRTPDPTILFANTMGGTKVSRKMFHQAFLALAVEANLDDSHFNLVGDLLDDRFEIKFAGERKTATSACHQFYSSLMLGKGRWKTQEVLSDSNAKIQLFVSPDKNTAQTRREMLAKHLKGVVAELSGKNPKDIWIKKETGMLYTCAQIALFVFLVIGSRTLARPRGSSWMPHEDEGGLCAAW